MYSFTDFEKLSSDGMLAHIVRHFFKCKIRSLGCFLQATEYNTSATSSTRFKALKRIFFEGYIALSSLIFGSL